MAIKEEGCLSGKTTEIINELLTILIYKRPLRISEQKAAIFIGTLLQKTNGFERVPSSGKVAELILVYTVNSFYNEFWYNRFHNNMNLQCRTDF